MNHPSQGNTQLFRRDLTDSEFSSVAYNPRQHTGKGYPTKKSAALSRNLGAAI